MAESLRPTIRDMATTPGLRQRVQEHLEELIIDGTLRPGERLAESWLADRLGVSRGPVREALQRLDNEGWVDIHPRRGALVHEPTPAEINDFFNVRRILESETARLAAQNATPQLIQTLRPHVDELRRVLDVGGDPMAVEHDDVTFHAIIATMAENGLLSQLLRLLRRRGHWYMSPLSVEQRQALWSEHIAVFEAIENNEPDRAAALMAQHTNSARRAYRAAVGANLSV